jgi:hypothetical protein
MSAHDGVVTLDEPGRGPRQLPPDPERYDSPRAQRARAKGLEAPYISGGEAPDADEAAAEERRLGRILLIMVAVIIAAGFVLGSLVALLGPAGQ